MQQDPFAVGCVIEDQKTRPDGCESQDSVQEAIRQVVRKAIF